MGDLWGEHGDQETPGVVFRAGYLTGLVLSTCIVVLGSLVSPPNNWLNHAPNKPDPPPLGFFEGSGTADTPELDPAVLGLL